MNPPAILSPSDHVLITTNHEIASLQCHVMNLKGFPLHWPMGLMAGARNRRLKTSPDGDAVRVCEGSSSEQAPLGNGIGRAPAINAEAGLRCHRGKQKISQNRAGDEGPGSDYPIET